METEPSPPVDPKEEQKKREEERKRRQEEERYNALPVEKKKVHYRKMLLEFCSQSCSHFLNTTGPGREGAGQQCL